MSRQSSDWPLIWFSPMALRGRVAKSLEAVGLNTLTISMHSLADVRAGLWRVGQALERDEAAQNQIAEIDRAVQTARQRRPPQQPKTLIVIDRAPDRIRGLVLASTDAYAGELVTLAGGMVATPASPSRYPKITAEELTRLAPDVILDLSRSGPGKTDVWNSKPNLPAVAHRRVHWLDAAMFTNPSPRIPTALDHLRKLLHAPPGTKVVPLAPGDSI